MLRQRPGGTLVFRRPANRAMRRSSYLKVLARRFVILGFGRPSRVHNPDFGVRGLNSPFGGAVYLNIGCLCFSRGDVLLSAGGYDGPENL
jgi:hypothetical protein